MMNKTHIQAIKPNRQKALFLAKKQLPELVFDAVNLEGINYTLPEVQTLLDGITVGGSRLQEESITLNQATAWQFLFKQIKLDSFNLSRKFVCEIHAVCAKEESFTWGEFRTGGMTIAGTEYTPPNTNKLARLWQILLEQHNSFIYQKLINDIEVVYVHAISLFLQMARTQFFYDANKRTGRLMMNGILLSNGLPAINLLAKKQLQFNQLMLDFYSSGDELQMQNFMFGCLDDNLVKIMSE